MSIDISFTYTILETNHNVWFFDNSLYAYQCPPEPLPTGSNKFVRISDGTKILYIVSNAIEDGYHSDAIQQTIETIRGCINTLFGGISDKIIPEQITKLRDDINKAYGMDVYVNAFIQIFRDYVLSDDIGLINDFKQLSLKGNSIYLIIILSLIYNGKDAQKIFSKIKNISPNNTELFKLEKTDHSFGKNIDIDNIVNIRFILWEILVFFLEGKYINLTQQDLSRLSVDVIEVYG